jgi:hypothetical protein
VLAIADEAVGQTESWLTALGQTLADGDEHRRGYCFIRKVTGETYLL